MSARVDLASGVMLKLDISYAHTYDKQMLINVKVSAPVRVCWSR
jgi:hypothetical protein